MPTPVRHYPLKQRPDSLAARAPLVIRQLATEGLIARNRPKAKPEDRPGKPRAAAENVVFPRWGSGSAGDRRNVAALRVGGRAPGDDPGPRADGRVREAGEHTAR